MLLRGIQLYRYQWAEATLNYHICIAVGQIYGVNVVEKNATVSVPAGRGDLELSHL